MKFRTGITILGIGIPALAGLNYVLRIAGPDDYRSRGVIEYYLVGRAHPVPLVAYAPYAIFSVFLFCQTIHAKEFSGTSQLFGLILNIVGGASFLE